MKQSLRALLAGAIDYAGLFPPAQLSLEETVRNYVKYREGEDAWMLAKLILPANRIDDLGSVAGELFSEKQKTHFSILVGGGKTIEEFEAILEKDLAAIYAIYSRFGRQMHVDVLEFKLPPDVLIETITRGVDRFQFAMQAFVEADRSQLHQALKAKAEIARIGIKIRAGGTEAKAFPSVERLASMIFEAVNAKPPASLKFTAGLHHPIRHFNSSVQTKMHGFINVFAATMLAHYAKLSEDSLCRILDCEDASRFSFGDDAMRFGDWTLQTAEIERLRTMVIGFGSCSFDEPREDLKTLGWM